MWIVPNEKIKIALWTQMPHMCRWGGGKLLKFTFITWLLVWEEENDVFIRRGAKFTCVCTHCTPSSLSLRYVADHNKRVCCAQSCSKSRIRIFTLTVSPGHLPACSFIIMCLHLPRTSTLCTITLWHLPRRNKHRCFWCLIVSSPGILNFVVGGGGGGGEIMIKSNNYLNSLLQHLRATGGMGEKPI